VTGFTFSWLIVLPAYITIKVLRNGKPLFL
jgi:hypothetical protein